MLPHYTSGGPAGRPGGDENGDLSLASSGGGLRQNGGDGAGGGFGNMSYGGGVAGAAYEGGGNGLGGALGGNLPLHLLLGQAAAGSAFGGLMGGAFLGGGGNNGSGGGNANGGLSTSLALGGSHDNNNGNRGYNLFDLQSFASNNNNYDSLRHGNDGGHGSAVHEHDSHSNGGGQGLGSLGSLGLLGGGLGGLLGGDMTGGSRPGSGGGVLGGGNSSAAQSFSEALSLHSAFMAAAQQQQQQQQQQQPSAMQRGYNFQSGGGLESILSMQQQQQQQQPAKSEPLNFNLQVSPPGTHDSSQLSLDGDSQVALAGMQGRDLNSVQQPGVDAPQQQAPARAPNASRYESQKRRDWNTFGQYLKNHRPPIAMSRCSSSSVVDFLRYLDQFGKTKVHEESCAFFGSDGSNPCGCPMKQAWGSLDSLVGRLRAAYEENGGRPENNPFAARAVRTYLRETRETQAKARGIAYEKKRKRGGRKLIAVAAMAAAQAAAQNDHSPPAARLQQLMPTLQPTISSAI